jgi:hypothetical protein
MDPDLVREQYQEEREAAALQLKSQAKEPDVKSAQASFALNPEEVPAPQGAATSVTAAERARAASPSAINKDERRRPALKLFFSGVAGGAVGAGLGLVASPLAGAALDFLGPLQEVGAIAGAAIGLTLRLWAASR